MDFRLKLLGVPKVDLKSRTSDLPLDKPTSLLYYLAQRGDWVNRSELAFLYRPDSPQKIALSNIRLYIHRANYGDKTWRQKLKEYLASPRTATITL